MMDGLDLKERRYFSDKHNTLDTIIEKVKCLIFNWCVGTSIFKGYSISDVMQNWDAVLSNR